MTASASRPSVSAGTPNPAPTPAEPSPSLTDVMDPVAAIEHFRAIVQSSDDAIISKSLTGVVTSWNTGATKIFGYTAEEMIGQPMLKLFPPHKQTEESLILERILEGERIDHFETVRKHKDGHLIDVAITISPVRNLIGQIVGASKIARDISDRVRTEKTTQHFQAIVATSTDAIISKSTRGVVTSWNPAAERVFGYRAEEMIGQSIEVLLPPDRKGEEAIILNRLLHGETVDHFETQRQTKDGRLIDVSVTISPLCDANGRVIGASKIARDITARKQMEQQLHLTASVFTHTSEAVVITDANGLFLEVNDAFTAVTGYDRAEVIGKDLMLFRSGRQGPEVYQKLLTELMETGSCRGEIWSRRKTGDAFAGLLTVNSVCDENGIPLKYVGIFADITPLRQQQERLERIVNFDPLTNLPNRLLLTDRLSQSLAIARRQHQSLAVAYLDLDGFKDINDRYGHDVGDELLIALAQRMQSSFRAVDTLARMGGDEFVAVLTDVESFDTCKEMLARILKACHDPVIVNGMVLQVSASLGATLFPHDDSDVDQLMRHADQAMYEAKQAGKNRFHLFDSEKNAEIKTRAEKINRIAQALHDEEFVLYYQPKMNMRSGVMVGAEALIRWNHPEQGLVLPGAFLPLIENHPLIEAIGEWVIKTVVSQLSYWKTIGLNMPVSVNVSARQFQSENFSKNLAMHLSAFPDVQPLDIELELLETSALENIEAVAKTMNECHRLGFHVAVDDFGTGYSSLTYLKRLPAETLKIDQSFVRDMLDDREDLAIVKGVIGLADAFNRKVIAEGVETIAHGASLIALGCECAQGFGIARPMPSHQLAGWAASWVPPIEWTMPAEN